MLKKILKFTHCFLWTILQHCHSIPTQKVHTLIHTICTINFFVLQMFTIKYYFLSIQFRFFFYENVVIIQFNIESLQHLFFPITSCLRARIQERSERKFHKSESFKYFFFTSTFWLKRSLYYGPVKISFFIFLCNFFCSCMSSRRRCFRDYQRETLEKKYIYVVFYVSLLALSSHTRMGERTNTNKKYALIKVWALTQKLTQHNAFAFSGGMKREEASVRFRCFFSYALYAMHTCVYMCAKHRREERDEGKEKTEPNLTIGKEVSFAMKDEAKFESSRKIAPNF